MKKETARLFAFHSEHQRTRFIADITELDPDVSYATSRGTHSVLNEKGDPTDVDTFIVAVHRP